MFAGRADDSLSVLIHFGIIMLFLGVFLLRFHKPATDCDCIQFVSANPTIQDLLAAGLHVEGPFALLFYDWNRKGKIIVTDGQYGAIRIFWIRLDVAFFFGLGRKGHGLFFVSHRILELMTSVLSGPRISVRAATSNDSAA